MNISSKWLCIALNLCSIWDFGWTTRPELGPVYQWYNLEFDYPSEIERQEDIRDGTFKPGVPAPIDVDVHYPTSSKQKSRIFVTIPRFQAGIPATLGVVSDRKKQSNPVIKPYPSWEWQTSPHLCKRDRIVSVYRVQIDECQRLWVLDTGRLLEEQVCPPQILAFDLRTNELLHRYEIPKNQLESRSILVTPIVDVRGSSGKCKDTFVYVADCQTYSIIVYDVQRCTSWKITDKTMYPYPNYGTFDILGDSFDLMDGILGMALSPYRIGEDRILFYHAMSSPTENWVYTSDLRNQSRFIEDAWSSPEIFHTYKGQRQTQTAAEAMDSNGIMYYGLMSDVTINCWNTYTEYGPANTEIIGQNKQTLQFASGVKVLKNPQIGEELWVLTSRFQKIGAGTIKNSEINFRILIGKVDDLVFGTTCESKRRPGGMGHDENIHFGGEEGVSGGGYGLWKPNSASSVSTSTTRRYSNSYRN